MSVTRFVGTALKGAAMGAANVIPGVSGGTIALISGIYQELIDTLKSFGWGPLKQLSQGQFKKCFESLNGPFLRAPNWSGYQHHYAGKIAGNPVGQP